MLGVPSNFSGLLATHDRGSIQFLRVAHLQPILAFLSVAHLQPNIKKMMMMMIKLLFMQSILCTEVLFVTWVLSGLHWTHFTAVTFQIYFSTSSRSKKPFWHASKIYPGICDLSCPCQAWWSEETCAQGYCLWKAHEPRYYPAQVPAKQEVPSRRKSWS